jgi:hypothetical protein
MKNQSEVTNEEMSLNYKNNSLIHKFKIIMQIIVVVIVIIIIIINAVVVAVIVEAAVVVVLMVVNPFILYCVPHTIFIQISHKMPSKKSNQKIGIYFVWRDNFHSSPKSVCICLQNFT